jgi:SAM-dependent methyltransferase
LRRGIAAASPESAILRRMGLWARCTAPYSLLRTLLYEKLSGLTLHGRVLDVGGGTRKSSYLSLLRVEGALESLNIDPERAPTFVADLNEPLPIPASTYDTILSLNTLEHVREDVFALREMTRILKPGGRMLIFVPFLYRVHGSPSDFHRHPRPWWDAVLRDLGLDGTVTPIGGSRYLAGYALAEPSRFHLPFRLLVFGVEAIDRQIRPKTHAGDADYALGYFIDARKR